MEFIKLKRHAYDLTNRRFGRIVAVGPVRRVYVGKASHVIWLCQCDCGGIIETRASNLNNGDTRSCGCLERDTLANRNIKHGHCTRSGETPEFHAWMAMRNRCENPNYEHFHRYGGRGISVSPAWREFSQFLADMGLRPTKLHSLDRINNDGNYEPGNCRWATRLEQGANQERNVTLTLDGETHCLNEWARRTGISQGTLWNRIRLGWSDIEVLTTPPRSRYHGKQVSMYTFAGKTQSISEWSRETGISLSALAFRLRKGWPIDRAFTLPARKISPRKQ